LLEQHTEFVFKPNAVNQILKKYDLTLTELADKIKVHYVTIYRSSLDQSDKNYRYVGRKMVSGVLTAFPDTKFEDYFDVILV